MIELGVLQKALGLETVTNVGMANSLHGLVRNTLYEVVKVKDNVWITSSIDLGATSEEVIDELLSGEPMVSSCSLVGV